MFSSLYVYATIILTGLALVGYIVHWWHLPDVVKARNDALEIRTKAQADRRDDQMARNKARTEAREKQRADREAARNNRRNRP